MKKLLFSFSIILLFAFSASAQVGVGARGLSFNTALSARWVFGQKF